MLRRFGLFGHSALIFYDKGGREQPDAQLWALLAPTNSWFT